MAGPIRIAILADGSQAQRTMSKTQAIAQKAGRGIRKAAVPAAAGLAAIAAGAYKATQAAAEDEASQKNLANALRRTAKATSGTIARNEAWISSMGSAYGVADDELRPAIAKLATATGSVTKAQKLARLAMDISARTGKPLAAVTQKIAQAQTKGSAAGLALYGVRVKEGKKARDLTAVLGDLSKKYKGSAAAAADTAAGKQKRFQLQLGELQEQIGAGLLPVLNKLTGLGLKVVGFFQQNEQVAKVLAIALGAVGVAILAVNAAMALNPAVLITAGIIALVGVLVLAYQRSASFRAVCDQVAQVVTTKIVPALQRFGQYIVSTVIPAVVRTAQAIGVRLRPILTQIAATFREQVQPTIAKVVAKFREMWPTIQRVVGFVARMEAAYLTFVAKVLGKVIPVLVRFAGYVFSKVVPAIADVIGFLFRAADRAIKFGKAVVDAATDAATFARRVVAKIAEVAEKIAGLPGQAITALGDVGSTLYNAGVDLIQGFIDGIGSMFGKVQGKLEGLTNKLTSWKGPPKRDKVLLRPAGRTIIDGLIAGFDDGTPGVQKVLARITNLIATTVKRTYKTDKARTAAQNRVVKGLRDEYAALRRNGQAQDRITARVSKARQDLAALRDESTNYAKGIRDSIVSYGSITSLGEGAGFANAGGLVDVLRAKLAQAQKYADIIQRLTKAGLNKTSIQQLLDAGVDSGLGTAEALLAGGDKAISQVNYLTTKLNQAGTSLGDSTSKSMYGAGIAAAQGLVRGLQSKARDLDRVGRRLAASLVAAVRKALGIHSPSRVFRDLGRFTAKGLTVGLGDVDVRDAGLRMADLLTRGFGAPQLDAALGGIGTPQAVNVRVHLTADVIDDIQRGRTYRRSLDAYDRVGGRTMTR